MRKSQQLLKTCITEAMLVKDRQMSNSLASSSGDAAGKFLTHSAMEDCNHSPQEFPWSLLESGKPSNLCIQCCMSQFEGIRIRKQHDIQSLQSAFCLLQA